MGNWFVEYGGSKEQYISNKVYRVEETFSTQEFVSRVISKLAFDEEVPMDVANAKFSDVRVTDHEILVETTEANIDYSALSIVNSNRIAGTYNSLAINVTENTDNSTYGIGREGFLRRTFANLDEDEKEELPGTPYVPPATENFITHLHDVNHVVALKTYLGNGIRQLQYKVKPAFFARSLYCTKRYEMDVVYKGKTYRYEAFPFGKLIIRGDEITGGEVEKRKFIWRRCFPLWLICLFVMLLSFFVSFKGFSTVLVVAAYALGMGALILHDKLSKKLEEKADDTYRAVRKRAFNSKRTALIGDED